MSKLSESDILMVSKLSRIGLETEEIKNYQRDLLAVLDYMKLLNQADTVGVEPTFQLTTRQNVMAPDVPAVSWERAEMLKNAPNHGEKFINVKGVTNE